MCPCFVGCQPAFHFFPFVFHDIYNPSVCSHIPMSLMHISPCYHVSAVFRLRACIRSIMMSAFQAHSYVFICEFCLGPAFSGAPQEGPGPGPWNVAEA